MNSALNQFQSNKQIQLMNWISSVLEFHFLIWLQNWLAELINRQFPESKLNQFPPFPPFLFIDWIQLPEWSEKLNEINYKKRMRKLQRKLDSELIDFWWIAACWLNFKVWIQQQREARKKQTSTGSIKEETSKKQSNSKDELTVN